MNSYAHALRRPTAALLLMLGACSGGDGGTGPQSHVPRLGTYDLVLTHPSYPTFAAGTARYTGSITLTSASAQEVAGTYSIQRVFTPALTGTPAAPESYSGQLGLGFYNVDEYLVYLVAVGTLQVRFVPRGSSTHCEANARYEDLAGPRLADATCTLTYRGP